MTPGKSRCPRQTPMNHATRESFLMNSNKLWHHALTFSTEAGCVIVLRAVKLSRGGLPAIDEAWRIVTEKTIAMGETSARAMQGKRPLALVFAYRRAVRNNLRRLSSRRK